MRDADWRDTPGGTPYYVEQEFEVDALIDRTGPVILLIMAGSLMGDGSMTMVSYPRRLW